jgi:hypothetical protein
LIASERSKVHRRETNGSFAATNLSILVRTPTFEKRAPHDLGVPCESLASGTLSDGWEGWARTSDNAIDSRALYSRSYDHMQALTMV